MGEHKVVVIAAGLLLLIGLALTGVAPTVGAAEPRPWPPMVDDVVFLQGVVFNGENNRLNAYDTRTGEKHTVIPSAADDPKHGLDINAEICFMSDALPYVPDGQKWFIAGEDTEQNSEPGVIKQGWGIFRLRGDHFDELHAREVGKLVPDSFVTEADNPENYGCGVLPDGRIVTSDVGDQLPQDPATGQLIVWFPRARHFAGPGADGEFLRVPHCKIDVQLGTAGGIAVDGTDVYVASNRPAVDSAQPGGVYRYDTSVWPRMRDGRIRGCSRTDATGAALADADKVGKALFIPQMPLLLTPSDIVDSGNDTWYVSSVFTGHVAEFDRSGMFLRYVLQPPAGAPIGQLTGITPFGIGVTDRGDLWVADIGVQGSGPAAGAGSVVRVRFDKAGEPRPPKTIDEGLEFPDGIGVTTIWTDEVPATP